jgi:hypothetical protein
MTRLTLKIEEKLRLIASREANCERYYMEQQALPCIL